MKSLSLTGALVFLLSAAHSQKINQQYQIHIQRANGHIEVDGAFDEADWQLADRATNFNMVLPMDTSKATVRTEVRMTYDAENIYLLAICYHEKGQRFMVESLKRDFSFGKKDRKSTRLNSSHT